MLPRVFQIVVAASGNDAINAMSLRIMDQLSNVFDVSTYSYYHPDKSADARILPLSEIPNGSPDDILLYHLSFGIPDLTHFLLGRPERLVVCYHNVTPAHFYESLLPDFAAALAYGRKEVEILSSRAVLSLGDSVFNATELREAGHRNVRVMPAGLTPRRLAETPIDCRLLLKLENDFPNGFILFVSQVLPHKRVDHALSILHLLKTVHRIDVGLVIAGPIRQPAYLSAVEEFATRLSGVRFVFTDSVTDSELATLYRASRCYIGTSQHEGLSIPPLEAMAEGVPVVVRGTGGVSETVGAGGIVLDTDCGVLEMTEAVAMVLTDERLASVLRIAGRNRAREVSETVSDVSMVELLAAVPE